jgi:hypothetical protein
LRHREVRLAYVLKRKRAPHIVNEFSEIRPLLRQSARQGSRTDGERPRHCLHTRPAMRQKPVDFAFNRGAQGACSRSTGLRSFFAIRTKRFQQVSVGRHERQAQHIVGEVQRVRFSSKLDPAIVEPVEILQIGDPRVRAKHPARTDFAAGRLPQSFDDDRKPELADLPEKMPWHADITCRERHALCSRHDRRPHVYHTGIAGEMRESLTKVFAGGNGIEEKARFSRVCLLRKVKSERSVRNGFRRVLDEPRLAERGHPLLTIIRIVVGQPRPSQQSRRVDVAVLKNDERAPRRETADGCCRSPCDAHGNSPVSRTFANILFLPRKSNRCGRNGERSRRALLARGELQAFVGRCVVTEAWRSDAGEAMRGLIALIVVVYLIGVGVALAPTIQSKWNSASAAAFADSVGRNLPYALAWPARAYRSIAERG